MSTQDKPTADTERTDTNNTADLTPAEEHRRAQETGEVFEGERYSGL